MKSARTRQLPGKAAQVSAYTSFTLYGEKCVQSTFDPERFRTDLGRRRMGKRIATKAMPKHYEITLPRKCAHHGDTAYGQHAIMPDRNAGLEYMRCA
jgi:hypothetical protein